MVNFRRSAPAALSLALAAGILGTAPQASAAPVAKVSITSVDAVVGGDRLVRVALRCTGAACAGKVSVKINGVGTSVKSYRLARGARATVKVKLSAARARKIGTGKRRATVTVTRKVAGKTKKVTKKVTVTAAKPVLRVTATGLTVGHDHVAAVTLRAGAAASGTVKLSVGGFAGGGVQVVTLKKGASATVRFALSDTQVEKLAAGSDVAGAVTVSETRPEAVARTTAVRLQLDHDMGGGDHDGHDGSSKFSMAYQKGWTPRVSTDGRTVYDTCTPAEHSSYAITGVDGKLYPSWHPAVHTRPDGSTCTFGHEHGDDPRNSDIYGWVISEYQKENAQANGIPFGYGSEQLMIYANATGSNIHRHEDDGGHKVIVSNDQEMGLTFTDRWGDRRELVCDILVKAHQGSWSSDATKNNTHELVYATSCNDGTKVLTTLMSNYGNANELTSSCTRPFLEGHGEGTAVRTAGSNLPDGEGGARVIPTLDCITAHVKAGSELGAEGTTLDDRRGGPASPTNGWWWAGYEQWQSFNTLQLADGTEIARFEPWFGLQNPSRYYVSQNAAGTDTVVGALNDLAWEDGNQQTWSPWKEQRAASSTKIDRFSPRAWFNGAIRDAWLTATKVDNADADSTVVHTTPWGKGGTDEPFTGSIRTVVSRTSNVEYVKSTTPNVLQRRLDARNQAVRKGASAPLSLGLFYDYGTDASGRSLGVHAPN